MTSCGGSLVAVEERHEVVRAVLGILPEHVEDEPRKAALVGAGLRHQRKIGRRLAAVRRSRGVLVRERVGEAVRRAAGTLEHVARLVRTVLDLVFGRESADLRLGEFRAARLCEVAERDVVDAVAGGADLAVDLEAALQLRAVELPERALKGPPELRRHRRLARGVKRAREPEDGGGDEESTFHHGRWIPGARDQPLVEGAAVAPAGSPAPGFCTPMTDSRIEFGSGSGRSTTPSTGSTIRKWAK